MKWEDLTYPQFAKAVKDTGGVCLLPLGCQEKHANHLPLGTDMYIGHKLACLAAEKEPAIVFPPYYFCQINEARHYKGTVALSPVMTLELLTAVCDEISRSGMKKIIIVNAHGGNRGLLSYFTLSILHSRKDYAVFVPDRVSPAHQKEYEAILETPYHGHACECETSISLHLFPELVDRDAMVNQGKAMPLNRLAHIPGGSPMGFWYADHPEHYAGDSSAATADKGRRIVQLRVDGIAEYIAAVKKDDVALKLLKEFYDKCDKPE